MAENLAPNQLMDMPPEERLALIIELLLEIYTEAEIGND